MSQPFRDFFSSHSADYARYRPHYPRGLFQHLSEACAGHDLAWDCATGNGQAAVALAPFFKKVVATDASEKQLKEAEANPKVEYLVATAENSGLAEHSTDLITVAQAFHWFDQPRFFGEVSRVAKPGGLLAVWCYELCTISPAVDAVVKKLYKEVLGSYWDDGRRLVEEGYQNEKFPFPEITAPKATMGLAWMIPDLVGYLGTWSALLKYRKATGEDPRHAIIPELQRAWGDQTSPKTVTWPLSVRLFRVP